MSLEIVAGLLGSGLVRAVASEVATTLACQAISAAVTSMARPGVSGAIVADEPQLPATVHPSEASVLRPVPTVEVLSAIPGRARLRVHGLRDAADRAAEVTMLARALDGVTAAEANTLTGTLLVRFDPQQTSVQRIVEALEPPAKVRPLRAAERAPYLRLVVG